MQSRCRCDSSGDRPTLVRPDWGSSVVISVENRPELGRYQIYVDGELAGFCAYEARGALVAFMHTEICEGFAGLGLGDRLVGEALDDIRAKGASVLPVCPFVRSFITRHLDYVALVPAAQHAAFGLSPGNGAAVTGDAS